MLRKILALASVSIQPRDSCGRFAKVLSILVESTSNRVVIDFGETEDDAARRVVEDVEILVNAMLEKIVEPSEKVITQAGNWEATLKS